MTTAAATTEKALGGKLVNAVAGRAIHAALIRLWSKGLADSHNMALRVAGGPRLPFDPTTPEGKAIYREVGDRIEGIQEETRARVRRYVARGRLEGMSPEQLANLIRTDPSGAFSRARARTIARTEAGMAMNRGSILGYRQSGRVTQVRVFDGDGCSWPDGHGDGPEADGMIVDLDEAEANPLGHPNCRRAWAPVVQSAGGDE